MTESERDLSRRAIPDQLFEDDDFTWNVTASGYRWANLHELRGVRNFRGKTERILTDVPPAGGRIEEGEDYKPLRVGGLFLTFADTPLTEDGMRAFANRYGFLGGGDEVLAPWPAESGGGEGYLRDAESWESWEVALTCMKVAVKLWRLVTNEDRRALEHLISWRPTRAGREIVIEHRNHVRTWHYHQFQTVAVPDGFRLPPNDVLGPARLFVQGWVNMRLWALTAPLLFWNADRDKQVMRIVPKTLLGAMWLQFARAVSGEVRYRPCKACGKWLTLSTEDDGFRSDREFCTAACRQKDYRAKVKAARQQRIEGRTMRQIAKHFNTTTDTIRNWLTKEK